MLTTEQVAEQLQVGVVTVRRWLQRRQLRGIWIGGQTGWRVPESEVRRFIEERRR